MIDQAPGSPSRRPERLDTVLKALTVLLVAAIVGLALLFGYTVWQSTRNEQTSTPAQRGLVTLSDLVRKNPNNAAARVRYGEALAAAGSLDKAVEQLQAAVKIDPKHTGAWLDLGIIAMQKKDSAAAEKYFKKVVDLTEGAEYENINNRREQALFHLGEIAIDEKRYEDAAGYLKASIRIRKDASDSYYLLGYAMHGLGSDDSALEQLDAALAFDPNYAEAHWLYGKILLAKGDEVNAAVHLRKAADLAPDRDEPAELLKQLGTVEDAVKRGREALAAKRVAEALEQALLARVLDPASADAVLLHVDVLVAKGDKKNASEVLAKVGKPLADDSRIKAKAAELGDAK